MTQIIGKILVAFRDTNVIYFEMVTRSVIHGKLSYRIMGCAFAVYNKLGPFFRESVYQKALEIEFAHSGIAYRREVPIELFYRDSSIGRGALDFLVEDKIILKLKAVESIHLQHVAQVLQYLATTALKLAILINFGSLNRLTYRRIVL